MAANGEEEYGFGLSVDGGNERIGSPTGFHEATDEGTDGMPDATTLESMFRELMETMNVSEDHEQDLLSMSDERKWKLIKNDAMRRVALPSDYFADQFRRHLDPEVT